MRRALLISPVLIFLGCMGPDHISIEPASPRLVRKGETVRLKGHAADRMGRVFVGERAFWTSRDPKVAAVTEQGEVAAVGSGHAVIEARIGSLRAEVGVEVDLVEKLAVDQPLVELSVTDDPVKVPMRALGLDGQPRLDRQITYTCSAPAVARVDPEGRIWGMEPGEAVITGKHEDKTAEVRVRVTPEKKVKATARKN